MSDKTATEISNTLKQLDIEVTGALGSHGPSTERVLKEGAPTEMLDRVARDGSGVRRGGTPGLDTSTSTGGTQRPGSGGHGDLASIGDTHGTAPTSAGSSLPPPPPKGGVQVAPPEPRGGDIPNAGGVVASMAPGFRRCYNGGLAKEDPTMHGSMRVTARIAANGDVVSATPTAGSGNLSGGVMSCVASRVASAHFDAPTAGGATLVIPVTFLLP
jgi:hypothetical protein